MKKTIKMKKKKSNDTINAFSSVNCGISKLKANGYSICYNIVFQTIKTNLLGIHTVFHYLIITCVQFLTTKCELPPLIRPPTHHSDSQNSFLLCFWKRSSEILLFFSKWANQGINWCFSMSSRPFKLPWLAVATQVPSIIDPSHICLFIGVTAGDQPVDLFQPWRLRTLKNSSYTSGKESQTKTFSFTIVIPWGLTIGVKTMKQNEYYLELCCLSHHAIKTIKLQLVCGVNFSQEQGATSVKWPWQNK